MDSAPLLIPDGGGTWSEIPGAVLAPKGFKGNGMYSGMRAGSKADLALVVCEDGAVAAGAFTQNVMCAAPVTVCKQVLDKNSSGVQAVRLQLMHPSPHRTHTRSPTRVACAVESSWKHKS